MYRWKPYRRETEDGVEVIRTFMLPIESRGLLCRLFTFVTFMLSSLIGLLLVSCCLQEKLLEWEKIAQYDGGDHIIFVCRVLKFDVDPGGRPLVFFKGKYCNLVPEA